jgi:hypothetical protein
VDLYDVNNGERFTTYAVRAPRGSAVRVGAPSVFGVTRNDRSGWNARAVVVSVLARCCGLCLRAQTAWTSCCSPPSRSQSGSRSASSTRHIEEVGGGHATGTPVVTDVL